MVIRGELVNVGSNRVSAVTVFPCVTGLASVNGVKRRRRALQAGDDGRGPAGQGVVHHLALLEVGLMRHGPADLGLLALSVPPRLAFLLAHRVAAVALVVLRRVGVVVVGLAAVAVVFLGLGDGTRAAEVPSGHTVLAAVEPRGDDVDDTKSDGQDAGSEAEAPESQIHVVGSVAGVAEPAEGVAAQDDHG